MGLFFSTENGDVTLVGAGAAERAGENRGAVRQRRAPRF